MKINEVRTERTFRRIDGSAICKVFRQNWFDAMRQACAVLGRERSEIEEVRR